MTNKKDRYVRMSTEDFNAVVSLLLEDKNAPIVKYPKY